MPEARMAVRRWLAGAATAFFVVVVGCGGGPCGGSENRMVSLSEFPCAETTANGGWSSHPFPPAEGECAWLNFQGCSEYTFENPLGQEPLQVVGYLAFEDDGVFSTIGSGNAFIIESVSDTEIVIRNAQNADFFLRLAIE